MNPFRLLAGSLLFVFASISLGADERREAESSNAEAEAGEGRPGLGKLDRLSSPSRILNRPETINALREPGERPQVLVYYGNGNAPTPRAREDEAVLLGWLREDPSPEVRRLGRMIEFDLRVFPQVIDTEAEEIRDGATALPAGQRIGVAIFTGALAADGAFQYLMPGEAEVRRGTFGVSEEARATRYPLSDPATLRAALEAVAEAFDPGSNEFVLVLKSHGSSERLLTPRVAVDVRAVPRQKLIDEVRSSTERRLAEFAEGAVRVVDPSGKPVEDAEGRGLLFKQGRLAWEGAGFVALIEPEGDGPIRLGDRSGQPFATRDGQEIVLLDGAPSLSRGRGQLRAADGTPLRLAGVIGFGGRVLGLASGGSRLPRGGGLDAADAVPLDSPVFGTGVAVGAALSKADTLGTSKDETPNLDKENTLGDNKDETPTLDKEMGLGNSKDETPILDSSKNDMPILDAAPVGTAAAGVTREELFAALTEAAGGRMYFPLLFLESCRSELPAVEVEAARGGRVPIGVVWTSDRTGLEYQTLDYAEVFARVRAPEAVADALYEALTAAWEAQNGK